MRNFKNFVLIVVSLCSTSCGYGLSGLIDDYQFDSKSNLVWCHQDDVNLIAMQFISLEGNCYLFKLTEDEALSKGISADEYSRILNDVDFVNLEIENWIREGIDFELEDPSKLSISKKSVRKSKAAFISRSESNPNSRTITTYDTQIGSDSFFAPNGTTSISFCCWCGALLQTHTVTTIANGGIHTKSKVKVLGTWDDSIEIAASNTYCTVQYSTVCSQGGSCTYYW